MQNRLKSQMLTLDPERIMCHTRIMPTAPLLTQLAFVPQCVPQPLWWGGDSRPSSARTRCQPSTNFERARESGVEIAIAKVCQGQENARGSQGGPLSTLSHFHSPPFLTPSYFAGKGSFAGSFACRGSFGPPPRRHAPSASFYGTTAALLIFYHRPRPTTGNEEGPFNGSTRHPAGRL